VADEMDTKPTIETVLERLGAFRNAIETRLEKIETDVSELRRDIAAGFHKVDRRFEVLWETLSS
jgi:hypothetical protein